LYRGFKRGGRADTQVQGTIRGKVPSRAHQHTHVHVNVQGPTMEVEEVEEGEEEEEEPSKDSKGINLGSQKSLVAYIMMVMRHTIWSLVEMLVAFIVVEVVHMIWK
jgi:hypothetical protein